MKALNKMIKAGVVIIAAMAAVNGNSQSFLTNGLVAFYPFHGNANDASGYGNNGTAYSVTNAPGHNGVQSNSLAFDGVNSIVKVTTGPSFSNTSFTVSMWLKRNSTATYDIAISSAGPTSILNIGFRQLVDTFPNAFTFSFYSSPDLNVPSVYSDISTWHSWVCTYNKSTQLRQIYRDGILVATNTVSGQLDASGMLYIGDQSYGNARFDGNMDDIRIYNRALPASEVAQLYAVEALPLVSFVKAFTVDYQNLTVGSNYQLQASSDLVTWTNWGSAFTATNSTYTNSNYQRAANWNQLYFRLQEGP